MARGLVVLVIGAALVGCWGGGSGAKVRDGGGSDAVVDFKSQFVYPDAQTGEAGAAFPQPMPAMMNGKVTLPPGTASDGLKVMALFGQAPVAADGQFQVTGAASGRQMVLLTDAQERPMLIGFGKAGEAATVSTKTTASVLLYMYTAAWFLPGSTRDRALDALMKAPETDRLARFLDQKMAANPSFIALSQPADVAALAEAVVAVLRAMLPEYTKTIQPLVLVNPPDAKSGIRILIGDEKGNATADINQISIMNEKRRRAMIFVDRNVGTRDVPVWQRDGEMELEPTDGFNGLLDAIAHWWNQTAPYTPKTVGPFGLGVPIDEKEVLRYRVVAAGPGGDLFGSGVVLSDHQKKQHQYVVVKSLVADAFMPLVLAFLDINFYKVDNLVRVPFFGVFVKDMSNHIISGKLKQVGDQLWAGDYPQALGTFLFSLANSNDLRGEVFRYMTEILFDIWKFDTPNGDLVGFLAKWTDAVLGIWKGVDKVLAALDFAAVFADIVQANSVEQWEVAVTKPKVLLDPMRAELTCGEKTNFVVNIQSGGQVLPTNKFYYKWKGSSNYGVLKSPESSTARDEFTTITKNFAEYSVNPTVTVKEGMDLVSVEVWYSTNALGGGTKEIMLGEARASAVVTNTCTSAYGYSGGVSYNSGCTIALSGPTEVKPGQEVTVTAAAHQGGVCASSYVWMSFAVSARLDGGPEVTTAPGSSTVYDFCYGGAPQPQPPPGVGVKLPDDKPHTITFKIDPKLVCPVCIREIANGTPCWSNRGNTREIRGPAIVMSGTGGTVGWTSLRFFSVKVDPK